MASAYAQRVRRQAAIFLLLLVASFIIWFPYNLVDDDVQHWIVREGRRYGVGVQIDDLTISSFPPKLSLTNLSLVLPTRGMPLPFFFNLAAVEPRLLPLILLKTAAHGTAAAYQGKLDAGVSRPLFGSTVEAEFRASDLHLESHPFLRGFGISGILETQGKLALSQTGFPLQQATAEGKLRDGFYYGGHRVASIITLPEISDIGIDFSLSYAKGKLVLENAELNSSLGTGQVTGVVTLDTQGNMTDTTLNAVLELSERGHELVGGYIALAANTPTTTPIRKWKLAYHQEANQPATFSAEPQ